MEPEDLVVVVYDSQTFREGNPVATRVTATLETGFGIMTAGPAVAFYAAPGRDFSMAQHCALDSLIWGPVLDHWGEGEGRPRRRMILTGSRSTSAASSRERDGGTP